MTEARLYAEAQRMVHTPLGWSLLVLIGGAWVVMVLQRPDFSLPLALLFMAAMWFHFFVPLARLHVSPSTLEVRYTRHRALRVPLDKVVACDLLPPAPLARLGHWLVPLGLVVRQVHGLAGRTVRLTLIGGVVVHVAARHPVALMDLLHQVAPLLGPSPSKA